MCVVEPALCPKCKVPPTVGPDAAGYEWEVVCHNCYDADCVGDPPHFVSRSLVGRGAAKNAAIADWNDQVEEAA